ncbi:P-loop containing nucleoside triphosphate hydrolase protein [Peziza echinospora]|nr:P-loop containing nucleoside triphosphate hydrolase protein [Peziza echinospora]
MSARLLNSARSLPLARRPRGLLVTTPRRLFTLTSTTSAASGGLLRLDPTRVRTASAARTQIWPSNEIRRSQYSNAVRAMSFGRGLPKLVLKFARVPAAFGGAMIAGMAYIQYQVQQAGNYTLGIFQQAGETVGSAFNGVKDRVGGALGGIEEVQWPEWLDKIFKSEGAGGKGGEGGNGGQKGPKDDDEANARSYTVAAGTATAAAFGYGNKEEEDPRSGAQSANDDQMMLLTKKMIEIRSILQKVGQSGALTLPSIVVIGSQSSGKSSVLEAVVGHEFLPKGTNMVTRRPIELTLINTPDSTAEYGEFPQLGLGKISDFHQIQRTLTDLNLAVPDDVCVSDDPIQLNIYSPNVPDLSLIDLPGYIQLSGMDQPEELKGKIAALCEKYIQAPNVILAISAADVDLANSTALRASRRVDPRGERTIGVITKMDLVDPVRAMDMLTDKNYPLRLGYVGVICRTPQTGLFSRNVNISSAIAKNEHAYFSQHKEFAPEAGTQVGTQHLRKTLMRVLEQTMAQSLQGTSDAIHQELEEATYEFKVQYNDRSLTAETYLAESLDAFKHTFKEFTERFGRPQVRALLKAELEQRVLDLLAQRYWNKPVPADMAAVRSDERALSSLPTAESDSLYWHRKLDASTSSLTKLGVGRLATNVTANALSQHLDQLIAESTFKAHPYAKQAIQEAANQILNDRFYSTSDQVENCIKPYKYEIDVDEREWAVSRENAQRLLKEELKACEDSMKELKNSVGSKKLGQVMQYIDKLRATPKGQAGVMGDSAEVIKDEAVPGTEAFGFSQAILHKGREGVFLRDRAELIRMRLLAAKSKQCASHTNKYYCPEIFLDVVAEKLTSTAVLFLNVELLSEFYYNFPRELDARLGRGLSEEEVERIAREDDKIRRHIDLQKRKSLLELALEKMDSLIALEKGRKGGSLVAGKGANGNGKEQVEGAKGRGSKGRWFL